MAATPSASDESQPTKLSLVEGAIARTIGGRYRLVRRIASGGMGTVYEAIDERTGRSRALKLLQPSLVSSETHRKRFAREATVTARFSSDFVADVLDAGIDEVSDSPYLVMPLLAGRDLAAEIEDVGALDPAVVVAYLTQVARALDRAHQAQVVHRDLKPANVFIVERDDGSKQAVVLDFGIAKLVDRVSTRATEAILGSPLYLAPEQVRYKKEKVSGRADVYALGQLAYTALVGEAYYAPEDEASDGVMGLMMEMAVGETQPASERAKQRRSVRLPSAFDAWFARATARDPAARFALASEAVAGLAEVFDLQTPSFLVATARRLEAAAVQPDVEPIGDEPRSRPEENARSRWPIAAAAVGFLGIAAFAVSTSGALSVAREPGPAAAPRGAVSIAGETTPASPAGARANSDVARAEQPIITVERGEPAAADTSDRPVGSASAMPSARASATLTARAPVSSEPRPARPPGPQPTATQPVVVSAPASAPVGAATGYSPPVTER